MESGLQHPNVIDLIAHDSAADEVVLVMTESRPWSDDDRQLFQLQEKINAYLGFALDGEMAEAYPHFVDRPLRLQLDCVEPPPERAIEFLMVVREQIAFRGIKLEVRVTGRLGSCGGSCTCEEP